MMASLPLLPGLNSFEHICGVFLPRGLLRLRSQLFFLFMCSASTASPCSQFLLCYLVLHPLYHSLRGGRQHEGDTQITPTVCLCVLCSCAPVDLGTFQTYLCPWHASQVCTCVPQHTLQSTTLCPLALFAAVIPFFPIMLYRSPSSHPLAFTVDMQW